MNFPTEMDRSSYQCCMFMLTCKCGFSKKIKRYTCSNTNPENAEKEYLGCKDRYTSSGFCCNFFVWAKELVHNHFKKCRCENYVKKLNLTMLDHSKCTNMSVLIDQISMSLVSIPILITKLIAKCNIRNYIY